jgi:chromosome segregation ATPase
MTTKEGAGKVDAAAGDAVEEIEPAPSAAELKQEALESVRVEIDSLREAISAQKAKGEITAASESTLQALYEELKAARVDLAELRAINATKPEAAKVIVDRWSKWLPW